MIEFAVAALAAVGASTIVYLLVMAGAPRKPAPARSPTTPESVKDAARALRRGEWTDAHKSRLIDGFTSDRRDAAWGLSTDLPTARAQAHGAALFIDWLERATREE